MRRFAIFVTALAPFLAAAGCEDGPNQSYSPAPAGAASVWNGTASNGDAGSPTYVGPGTQDFDASFGGTTANDTCTPTQAKAIWASLFQEPIAIPGAAGGIDMAGGPNGDGSSLFDPNAPNAATYVPDPTKETWLGTTVEQAEKILCTGVPDQIFGGVTNEIGWGNSCPSCEMAAQYNVDTRKITTLDFEYGYQGKIIATSDPSSPQGKHTYEINLQNLPITKDGQPLTLNWNDQANGVNPIAEEVYDAIRNTYAPTYPADYSTDKAGNKVLSCVPAGHCIIGNNGAAGGYLFFASLQLAVFVLNTTVPQPAASVIGLVDLGLLKLLPFSLAAVTMKLDAAGEGPTAIYPNVAGTTKTCKITLGQTFADFDSTCVEPAPASDPAGAKNNAISRAKLFGAISHGDEAYLFNVQGVDPQFVAALQPTKIIADTDRPTGPEISYQFNVDQFALGPIANDFTNNDVNDPGGQDFHGLGMVTLEWANLVQKYMQDNHGVNVGLGDADCIADPTNAAGITIMVGTPPKAVPKVCSGVEGIITSAPPALAPASMAYNAVGAGAANFDSVYANGLKPGTWYVDFCHDASPLTDAKPKCFGGTFGGPSGFGGYYFSAMQYAVQRSFGTNPVPTDVASRRFFFKQWILAVIKYLQTADNVNATLAQIDANPVDPSDLFFDSAGGGFETGEYVFRNQVNSLKQPPTALVITTNLTTSVVNNFTFDRYNFRGETALYTALRTNPADGLGAEPLYLTNIVGSPVLQSIVSSNCPNPAPPAPPLTFSQLAACEYACAINTDPNQCGGYIPPTDPFTGESILKPYAAAFGASPLNIAANGYTVTSPMTVQTTDYELINSALVTLPIWTNPFDPTSATAKDKTISVLLPYHPKGANIGFPITLDGSRDKFYNTYSVDFDGDGLQGNVDFEYVGATTADGGVTSNLVIRAVETQQFTGLVFPCFDSGSGDLLAVRMYTQAADILSWIASHPASVSNCGVEIKYSPYANFADYISFNLNGVRLGLNAGFGGSVVSDGTLFDPNVVANLGQ